VLFNEVSFERGELVRSKKCGHIGLVIWVLEGDEDLAPLIQVHWIGRSDFYLAEWFREGSDFLSESVEKL
jgi:hypothetical protein